MQTASGCKRVSVLELELVAQQAEAAALRNWIERHCPTAPILSTVDAGRDILDRLWLAEVEGRAGLVEGLFELRDSLAVALSLVSINRGNRGMFAHLRGVLNRWGDQHLRLQKRGSVDERRRDNGVGGDGGGS